jgi:crotonobetainyl-CoA:carnitine CoA-transferase CaiB-like acyl-CoA transferase
VNSVSFLSGLRVLELGDGVAGAGASSLLAALGAEVTTVSDPASTHRNGNPAVDSGASLLSVVLDRGKQIRSGHQYDLDTVTDLIAEGQFDLVLVDRVSGLTGPLTTLQDVDAYLSFVGRANRKAWLTISAFGLTGERRGDVAGELTVAAASGMLASVHNPETDSPMKLAGYQSLLNTSQAAALAACHAVDLAAGGHPAHLDLSAVEATIATGPTLEASTVLLTAGGPGGAKRYGAPASFYACRDGLIRISAMEDHQWRGVVVAMRSPAWTDQFATTQSRIDGQDEIDARIAAWAATIDKVDAETLLQANGVPATAMYSPHEILSSPQLAHRDSFERLQLGEGATATIVGSPYRSMAESGQVRRRSIRGLRVAEVSHVLAIPLAGAVLAALGAEVTKLEDLKRIDMYRRRGPYIDNTPHMERSSYFALVNHSKRSEAFDFEDQPERLSAILEASDVVVENVGGKRAAKLGIAASEVPKKHPGVLSVSSSGFGQDGPFSTYRAYAYNLQASCCLGYLTRGEGGEAAEIDLPWADLVSGFAVATVIAAWAVGPLGNPGIGLDFAMADLVIAHFNEFIAAASIDAGSDAKVDRANEMSRFAPHGVYATEDGWIAISVTDDRGYRALCDVLGSAPLGGLELSTGAGRYERRRDLDALIGEATTTTKASTLAQELRAVGVDAEEVISGRQLPDVAQLGERDFFTWVDHPEWGRKRLIGIPWRPYGQPAIPLGAPPQLIET